jgi:hypothetical protein
MHSDEILSIDMSANTLDSAPYQFLNSLILLPFWG